MIAMEKTTDVSNKAPTDGIERLLWWHWNGFELRRPVWEPIEVGFALEHEPIDITIGRKYLRYDRTEHKYLSGRGYQYWYIGTTKEEK